MSRRWPFVFGAAVTLGVVAALTLDWTPRKGGDLSLNRSVTLPRLDRCLDNDYAKEEEREKSVRPREHWPGIEASSLERRRRCADYALAYRRIIREYPDATGVFWFTSDETPLPGCPVNFKDEDGQFRGPVLSAENPDQDHEAWIRKIAEIARRCPDPAYHAEIRWAWQWMRSGLVPVLAGIEK